QEAKRIGLDSVARLEAFKSQTTSAQTALSGDLDALKRTIVNDIRPKQAQAETEIAKQVEALSRTKNELAGASTLFAQEAKRIELDSVARLEAFKSQTTSAQTALSGDLDVLKRTIANDIRPKQAQAEAEIAKQVEALSRTKNELAGVKSAQATYEETTTRRLSELTNLANGKASKSELTQTAEELSSKIASVQASGRNLFLNSLFKQDISKTGIWTTSTYTAAIDSESKYLGHKALKIIGLNPSGRDGGNPKVTYPALGQFGKVIPGSTTNQDVTISFYAKANKNGIMLRSRLGNIGYKTGNVTLSTEIKRYVVHIPKGWTNESKQTTNEWLFNFNQEGTIWIWMPKFEISDVDTSYSEAPEDIEGQISTVESNFKQRADSLEAGVSRLTEGLRTKADISALNVTAENIRQSVKSLETDTQNKLNQKLSQAEFEVRAGSIRQEILNATKDKADKTLVVSEAGKLREEFSKMKVGGRNLWIKSKTVGAVIEKLPENHVTGQKECYRLENNSTLTFNLEPDFSSRLYQKVTFSAWIKYENVVQGRNFWNVFNCFKHYLFRKNSETGVQSGPDYATLGMYKGSADWKYITFTYDYSEKTNFDQLKTSLRFNLEGATSGTAWVTGIKVEIGSVATDWSPAPEDADGLITEAKATFERTAQGLRTDLSAIQEYVNKDGQRQEALQRYTREESTRQATAVRELVNRDFVGKATYQEDVKGINQRIEAVKTSANTEGLRTKADISALNVTAENIRQSVKSLETDTQNKLNQKLSQAEFEVRAGSIR
ncbi:peptidase S74, partial [Streptococcus pneumoniae]|nr:peptidase S74 [Streptococcus pneumoniae]